MRQSTSRTNLLANLSIFALLVLIGVAGRWGQPVWAFTPIAAVTLLAAVHFRRVWVAALVPFSVLFITDTGLVTHDNLPVMLTVYAAMMAPALLGGWLRREGTTPRCVARVFAASFMPATLFFVVTNLAVWLFRSDYAASWAGLAECYAMALPFYRNMLAGDVAYTALLFGAYAVAMSVPGERRAAKVVAQ